MPVCLTEARILRELHQSPLDLGYAALTWTVPLLTWHLQQRYHCQISPWTLRQQMKQIGLEWKRPRYRISRLHMLNSCFISASLFTRSATV
jgi:hypothetical protein